MIPQAILDYLDENGVRYRRRVHRRAVSAQELAAAVHVSGHRVGKTVIVEVDDDPWMVVLPAAELLNLETLAHALRAIHVRMAPESTFADLFPGCEVGAEPPFGELFGLPVVLDSRLAQPGPILFRAGSHEEALELDWDDYIRLEEPRIEDLGEAAAPLFSEGPEPLPY